MSKSGRVTIVSGQELAKTNQKSVTLFSVNTLKTVEHFAGDIDATTFYIPPVKPTDGPRLMAVHHEMVAALRPADQDQIERALINLRMHSHRTNETRKEAQASFDAIAQSLRNYPIDIVRRACRAYAIKEKFFPRSPAEIIRYAAPILGKRVAIARNSRLMAEEAERKRQEHERLSAPPVEMPDAELIAFGRPHCETELRMGWITQEQFDRCFPPLASDGGGG
jgi:hypothetical protein